MLTVARARSLSLISTLIDGRIKDGSYNGYPGCPCGYIKCSECPYLQSDGSSCDRGSSISVYNYKNFVQYVKVTK